MAIDSTISIKMQGVDNASDKIKAVKTQLEGLGTASGKSAASLSAGGDAIRAAMGAASGSLTGAIGAANGLKGALVKLGATATKAGVWGYVIAAAIAAFTIAYQRFKKAQEDAAKEVDKANAAILKQADAVDKLAGKYKELQSFNRRVSDLQGSIANETQFERNRRNRGLAKDELANIRDEKSAIQEQMASLAESIRDNLAKSVEGGLFFDPLGKVHKSYKYSEKEREAYSAGAENMMEKRRKLEERLSALVNEERIQELTVKALNAEGIRLFFEMARAKLRDFFEKVRDVLKGSANQEREGLIEEQSALRRQLSNYSALDSRLRLASVYEAGSHSTNLLLDRLSGAGNDATTAEVAKNVRTIADRLAEIEQRLEHLNAI